MSPALTGLWHRTLRRIGPLGVAAGALLAGAMILGVWTRQLDMQGIAIDATVAAMPGPTPAVPLQHVPLSQQIGEFVSAFPPFSQNPDDLREVFLSAKRHNIQLPRGEYRLKTEAKKPLIVFTATFPVTTDYGAMWDFAADVLRALPNVSMDELRMARNSSGGTALESSVRFSFVYRRS